MPVTRTVGRSVYGRVIAKFSGMGSLPHFLTHGAPLRARELRQKKYVKFLNNEEWSGSKHHLQYLCKTVPPSPIDEINRNSFQMFKEEATAVQQDE